MPFMTLPLTMTLGVEDRLLTDSFIITSATSARVASWSCGEAAAVDEPTLVKTKEKVSRPGLTRTTMTVTSLRRGVP